AIGLPRKVNPGKHVVAAKIGDGKVSSVEVVFGEKESRNAPLTVEAPAKVTTTATSAPPTTTAIPTSTATSDRGLSPWFWVGVALTGVGVASGAVTGILSTQKASSVKKECFGTDCPPSAQSDIDGARATGTISTISFIVAGVGATIAIIAFVSSGSGD